MSVSNYQKHISEAAYKNTIKNKSNTDNNLAWYEEPKTVTPKVDAKSIWLDSEYIPTSPDDIIWKGNYYYTTINKSNVAVVEKFEKSLLTKVNDRAVFYSAKLIDAIQDENYHIIIVDANDEIIPFGLKKWTIDGGIGYLSFTDGLPSYTQPFYVTGYRYCGRKLPEHMITTDGRQTMLEGYEPSEDLSVATKVYVDDAIADVNKNVDRMLPPIPATFKGKDLTFICDKKFTAKDIATKEDRINIVLPSWDWTIDIPEFYNPGIGRVSLLASINSVWNEIAWIDLSSQGDSVGTNIDIEYDGDAYDDSLSARGFYNSIKCSYTASFDNMSGLFKSHLSPVIFKMRYTSDTETFYSNELEVNEELAQETDALSSTSIVLSAPNLTYKYVSGIATPTVGSIITVSGINHITLKKFTTEAPYEDISMIGQTFVHFPELPYSKYVPNLECKQDFEIKENYYNEILSVKAQTYNVFGEPNGTKLNEYNFRIDTKSDESNRVTSGIENDKTIEGSCKEWDPTADLRTNNELQLLGGVYQWPTKDFSINGTGAIVSGSWADNSWIRSSLNYSECSKIGKRFVTLKYNMSIANGVYISVNDAVNLKQDIATHAYKFDSMYIKVEDETDWLNAQESYDGIGTNKEWMQGCLAVQDSTDGRIYCTFGPKPIEGILYIRIGITYDSGISFSGLTVEENI